MTIKEKIKLVTKTQIEEMKTKKYIDDMISEYNVISPEIIELAHSLVDISFQNVLKVVLGKEMEEVV